MTATIAKPEPNIKYSSGFASETPPDPADLASLYYQNERPAPTNKPI